MILKKLLKSFNNKKIYLIFKLAVSIGLICYLIFLVDWERAWAIISTSDKSLIIVAPFFWLIGLVFAAQRWRSILGDRKVEMPFSQAYEAYLRGLFYSIFLPGSIGGDAVRVGICKIRTKSSLAIAASSVFLERIGGFISVFFYILFSFYFYSEELVSVLPTEFSLLIMILTVSGVTSVLIIVLGRKFWFRLKVKKDSTRFKKFFYDGIKTFSVLQSKTLLKIIFFSGLFQAVDIFVSFIFSRAIGINLPFVLFFAIVPIVYLVIVLPISLGGLGVREGAFAFLLAKFGVPTTEAITLSFLIYLNRVFIGGIGGMMQMRGAFWSEKEEEDLFDSQEKTNYKVEGRMLNGKL
jgi:uncharacterized protein (TIRG00374 family)